MNIKINKKVLSIPPYISTSWSSVQALRTINNNLQVILIDGTAIEIPSVPENILAAIFEIHASIIETSGPKQLAVTQLAATQMGVQQPLENMLQLGFAAVDEFGAQIQHNPAQAGLPDMPKQVLEKISTIAKVMMPQDLKTAPRAEPGCNCMHCQIARAIAADTQEPIKDEEEIVTENDLHFEQWNVQPSGDQLFNVTNKLDPAEHYSVFLGEPIGCTCGKKDCEHIVAVLKS